MKCPNCKKKIEKGKKFCGYCGAAIPEKAKRKVDKRILIPAGVAGVCGVALLGTVILTNPQQTSASKLEKKIAAGNRYLQSADYEKAEVAFNEALSIDKKSSDAALGLAKVCNEKKDPEGALSYLKLANENLESMSTKQVEEKKLDWEKKSEDYQKTFDNTSQLFLAAGNQEQAQYVQAEKEKTEKAFVVIELVVSGNVDSSKEFESSQKSSSSGKPESAKKKSAAKQSEEKSIGDLIAENYEYEVGDVGGTSWEDSQLEIIDEGEAETITTVPELTEAAEDTSEETAAPEENPEEPTATETPEEVQEPTAAPEEVVQEPTAAPEKEVQEPTAAPEEVQEPTEVPEEDVQKPTEIPEEEQPQEEPTEAPEEEVQEPTETPEEDQPQTEPTAAPEEAQPTEEAPVEEQPQEEVSAEQPEESAETPAEEPAGPVDEELLYNYVNQELLATGPVIGSQSLSYDFAVGNIPAANGTVSYQVEDLDGDGNQELLVVTVYNGQMGFDIYRVKDSVVTLIANVSGYYTCLGSFDQACNYGMTQICFLKDEGGVYSIGLASNSNGNLAEGKAGAVQTSIELYSLSGDEVVLKNAVSIKNGISVCLGADDGAQAVEGGKDAFIAGLNGMGMDGSWISESADVLTSMNLTENPVQNMAVVPDPFRNGLAAIENGVQDVAYINGLMYANMGTVSLNILDHPGTDQCAGNYQQIPDSQIELTEEVPGEEASGEDGQEAAADQSAEENPETADGADGAENPEAGGSETLAESPENAEGDTVVEEPQNTESGAAGTPEETEMEYGIPVATEDGTYTPEETSSTPEDTSAAEEVYQPEDTSAPEEVYEPEDSENAYIPEDTSASDESIPSDENVYEPENTETEAYTDESEVQEISPDEVLQNFANENIWSVNAQVSSQTAVYDYETGTISGTDGILGLHKADLDKDGVPELLTIRSQSGQIVWDIYRVNGSTAELVSTTVPSGSSLGKALTDYDYEMSQVCFLKDNGENFQIGIASNYRNVEEEGLPSVRTNVELYNVSGWGCDLAGSVTILNGRYVYNGTDRSSAEEGGSDSFMARVGSMGLSGSWITESTAVLDSMDILNNPGQDVSAVPDSLENGISAKEDGTQDLVVLKGDMAAGSGSINISVTDNTQMN